MDGGGGGRDYDQSSSNTPHGSSSSSSSSSSGGGVAETDTLKAVLELGKRDAVKRLLQQARIESNDLCCTATQQEALEPSAPVSYDLIGKKRRC